MNEWSLNYKIISGTSGTVVVVVHEQIQDLYFRKPISGPCQETHQENKK